MSNSTDANNRWDIPAARTLYNINRWGAKYFDINEAGEVVATPLQDAGIAKLCLGSYLLPVPTYQVPEITVAMRSSRWRITARACHATSASG